MNIKRELIFYPASILTRRPLKAASANDVEMEMRDSLASILACVDHHSKSSLTQALLPRDSTYSEHEMRQQLGVFALCLRHID